MVYQKIRRNSLALVLSGIALLSCGGQSDVQPPVAKTEAKVDTLFGHEMVDSYYWMRDKENPEVIEYLNAENAYTEAKMAHTEELQDSLFIEMKSRIKETDLSVPVKRGNYYYYSRTEEGKQYKIYCRKEGSLEAEEETLLDVNALAEGLDYCYLGVYAISPDHKLLAYAADTSGNERYSIYIKDLETGELRSDVIHNAGRSFEWANDNRTFFYNISDDAWRSYQIYKHRLGENPENDEMIFQEDDDSYDVWLYKSKDDRYIFMHTGNQTTSEVYFLNANYPSRDFKVIQPRTEDVEYWAYHHGGYFYIVTNENALNYKLMRTSIFRPQMRHWSEVIAHRDSVKLDNVEIFRDYMAIYERADGFKRMRIKNMSNGKIYDVQFPEPVYNFWSDRNPEFDSNVLRFTYTSFITPESVYDFDLKTREKVLRKQEEVLGAYQPEQYESKRTFAVGKDGARIPVSLVYKKEMKTDGTNPLYLNAYGAYGSSSDPYFSSNRLSLLDRGFIYAVAHIRGGGEMGRKWYDDGKLLNKKNSFNDLIAVAEHLIAEGYTSNEKLVLSGGSAGGLLVGAVANMRPDLFKVITAGVPFVDIINTMLDPSIPLTVREYDEWGNPNEKEYFEYMLSYSPYDNVTAQDYPNILITASLNDTRVQYWEPAKWTAKLRAHKTDDNLLLLKMNMGAGHGGASGRYDWLEEIAFKYAFILDRLGIES